MPLQIDYYECPKCRSVVAYHTYHRPKRMPHFCRVCDVTRTHKKTKRRPSRYPPPEKPVKGDGDGSDD